MTTSDRPEDRLRDHVPAVLGALARRTGQFDLSEDAVQEALLAAAVQWPRDGVPDDPRAWLMTVASRRLTDRIRSDSTRRRREELDAARRAEDEVLVPAADDGGGGRDRDDTLALLFMCCHPALSAPSRLALTLRAVGGLSTAEIARAFLVPESTMAQRISRAKQRIREAGAAFDLPDGVERSDRLAVVLHVLYLMFTEGHTASSGDDLQRPDLTAEAIRLARQVHRMLPDDGEGAGLLALMLLTDARRDARVDASGQLVTLEEQDRTRWDRRAIAEGEAIVTASLASRPLGPYQVQAAIAAVHDEAPHPDLTDWAQIAALYGVLERLAPNPLVTLNRAVAVANVEGPDAGLAIVRAIDGSGALAAHHRVHVVRAHLLEMSGDDAGALEAYREAARRTPSLPERRHLELRAIRVAARVADGPESGVRT